MPGEHDGDPEHRWEHDGRVTTFTWLGDVKSDVRIARVFAIAVTLDGRILLVGAGGGDRSWWLPGGAVEDGETQEEALRRELAEEAGATIEALELLGYQRVVDPLDGESVIGHFWARVDVPLSFEPKHEVTETLLVPPENVLQNLFWSDDPTAQRLLQLALAIDARRSAPAGTDREGSGTSPGPSV